VPKAREILRRAAFENPHLFEAARSLNGAHEARGPSLVVAQAAVEVGMEAAIDLALQLREIQEPVIAWVGTTVPSWSPGNRRVQSLWTALTGDRITEAPGWAAYVEGLKLRHAFVHKAEAVSQEKAASFISAAEQIAVHVVDVLENVLSDWNDAK